MCSLTGFKSYPVRTQITGWDPSFNAITGLNGSGKSNILDAICFVLGITNMSTVCLSRRLLRATHFCCLLRCAPQINKIWFTSVGRPVLQEPASLSSLIIRIGQRVLLVMSIANRSRSLVRYAPQHHSAWTKWDRFRRSLFQTCQSTFSTDTKPRKVKYRRSSSLYNSTSTIRILSSCKGALQKYVPVFASVVPSPDNQPGS